MKPVVKGIICLAGDQVTPQSPVTQASVPWTNPNISGIRFKIPWGYLETSHLVYDWSLLDNILVLAQQNNVPVGISISNGFMAPTWLYDLGCRSFTTVSGPDIGTMPIISDPKFQNNWETFIRAVANRYDSNPFLQYVVLTGLGQQGVELYVGQSEPDSTNLIAAYGSIASWQAAAQSIASYFYSHFTHTPLYVALAKPFQGAGGLSAEQSFTSWGTSTYPNLFGVMCNSLSVTSNTGYYPNQAVHDDKPSGFQMVCAGQNTQRLGGTLTQAIDNGISMLGQFIEVYQPDIMNPANQQMLASRNAMLRQ